ncbi:polymorphic toxin-type HINT domain-containing protein, partial [Massilia sp. DJPM01]|uniref:polymorphic toxin-type HINT domain-containing protein n=1 Tax=Massilia sp. DJPM01 TaxID=3024404 RepID=UPI00259D94FA
QLHDKERKLAEKLAQYGQYTAEEIKNALRASGNSELGENDSTGMFVLLTKDTPASAFYDIDGWKLFVPGAGQPPYMLQSKPMYVDPALANYILNSTGDSKSPYAWDRETLGYHEPTRYPTVNPFTPNQYGCVTDGCAAGILPNQPHSAFERNFMATVQFGGGSVQSVSGGALVGVGVTSCAETLGAGCLVALFGGYQMLTGWDNTNASIKTLRDQEVHGTTGAQVLQDFTGLSPGIAELLYAGSQFGTGIAGVKLAGPSWMASAGKPSAVAADLITDTGVAIPPTGMPKPGLAPVASAEVNVTRMSELEVLAQKIAPCCFATGTLVATPSGYVAIEALKLGDQVWTRLDDNTGAVFASTVTATHSRDDQPIYRLTLGQQSADANRRIEQLLVTPGHPFYVRNRGFVSAIDLKVGDQLTSRDQSADRISVAALELIHQQGRTYNLTVDVGHTFFVGKFETWVHNVGPCATCSNGLCTIHSTGNNSLIPGSKDFIGPLTQIDSKILFGTAKPGTNNIIGGHSPEVLSSPRYTINPGEVVNADGTISVTGFKGTIVRKDGIEGLSKSKSQNTFAPLSWSNADILSAGQTAAAVPGIIVRDIAGVKTTVHMTTINGVEWAVLKDNGVMTSSFPTGGKGFP